MGGGGGGGEREKTTNEKGRKMPYNGLSANAKGWLLVKHHFATSLIFHQHVKVSAPASLPSPHNPFSFFLSSSSFPFVAFTGEAHEELKVKV